MYTYSIVPMTRSLRALAAILTKAEAHCEERGIKPEALLTFRLFPDMMAFTRQVQLTCDFAARASARLAGAEVPSFPDTETSFAELEGRITAALAALTSHDKAAFDGADSREVTLKIRGQDVTMTGQQFLSIYSLPQFYFHLTTAYNILRHNGVDLGKGDYMGV